jgi:hypothetical protein
VLKKLTVKIAQTGAETGRSVSQSVRLGGALTLGLVKTNHLQLMMMMQSS